MALSPPTSPQVVRWSSITSLISNSLIAFIFSPLVGDASDVYGRKPFLTAAFSLALLPAAVVVAHVTLPNPRDLLLLYYPASVISGVVSSIAVCLSYCADKLPPRHRTAGFGLIIAAFCEFAACLAARFSHRHRHHHRYYYYQGAAHRHCHASFGF